MSKMFLKSPVESLQDMGAVRAWPGWRLKPLLHHHSHQVHCSFFFSARGDSLSYSPNVEQSQSLCRAIKQINLPKKHR